MFLSVSVFISVDIRVFLRPSPSIPYPESILLRSQERERERAPYLGRYLDNCPAVVRNYSASVSGFHATQSRRYDSPNDTCFVSAGSCFDVTRPKKYRPFSSTPPPPPQQPRHRLILRTLSDVEKEQREREIAHSPPLPPSIHISSHIAGTENVDVIGRIPQHLRILGRGNGSSAASAVMSIGGIVDRALGIDGEGGWLPGVLLLLLTVSSVGGSSGDEGKRLELLIMFC